MVARFFKFSLLITFILFAVYLTLPSPEFPKQPPDSVQSLEEADTEATKIKRAYFTNFTREDVLVHYQKVLSRVPFLPFRLPTYRLNYPPEESQTLIRDQTRTTFLEEIVHPFRESFFVNGFEPKDPKDEVWSKGVHYGQKIVVKYIPSPVWVRVPIAFAALFLFWVLTKEMRRTAFNIFTKCFSND